jgi:3-oxoacyl-ACP reductase-like protein
MAPVQSEAASPSAGGGDKDDYKITKDYKERIQKDVNAKSSKTNQHLGQDTLCYKDDDCEQTTEGEQIKGKDNEAKGFNDQNLNVQQDATATPTTTSTPTTTPTPGNGTTPTPTPRTCVECFTTALSSLTPTQLTSFIDRFSEAGTIASLCDVSSFSASLITSLLVGFGVNPTEITTLLNCLRAAGVTVTD